MKKARQLQTDQDKDQAIQQEYHHLPKTRIS